MYSRVTALEIDTLRVSVEETAAEFRTEILPLLEQRPGYEGTLVLATPEGQGIVVTFWETAEAADASADLADEAVERFVTVFRSPPGREHYEVLYADLPAEVAAP
jgi:hypothetical protein